MFQNPRPIWCPRLMNRKDRAVSAHVANKRCMNLLGRDDSGFARRDAGIFPALPLVRGASPRFLSSATESWRGGRTNANRGRQWRACMRGHSADRRSLRPATRLSVAISLVGIHARSPNKRLHSVRLYRTLIRILLSSAATGTPCSFAGGVIRPKFLLRYSG